MIRGAIFLSLDETVVAILYCPVFVQYVCSLYCVSMSLYTSINVRISSTSSFLRFAMWSAAKPGFVLTHCTCNSFNLMTTLARCRYPRLHALCLLQKNIAKNFVRINHLSRKPKMRFLKNQKKFRNNLWTCLTTLKKRFNWFNWIGALKFF